MSELANRYNNSFQITFDKVSARKDNKVKVFQAPMGFGKTYNLITEWIVYAFDSGNVDYAILTAPKTDIVTDNTELLNDVVSELSGVVATTNVKEFMRRLKRGKKTILYTTNQAFFVEKKGDELEKLLGTILATENYIKDQCVFVKFEKKLIIQLGVSENRIVNNINKYLEEKEDKLDHTNLTDKKEKYYFF